MAWAMPVDHLSHCLLDTARLVLRIVVDIESHSYMMARIRPDWNVRVVTATV